MKTFIISLLLITSVISPAYSGEKLSDNDINLAAQSEEVTELENLFKGLIKVEEENRIEEDSKVDTSKFWKVVYAIETTQGLYLYRPRNKSKSCRYTSSPCGHHQLSALALKDIGCTSRACRVNRENYTKSLAMTKKLQSLNTKRLSKYGIVDLPEYQQYLVHQQGAYGVKKLIKASGGKSTLSKRAKKNLANNSPYSFNMFKKMSSQQTALIFLYYWKKKWNDQKKMVTVAQLDIDNQDKLPTHKQMDLELAYNN